MQYLQENWEDLANAIILSAVEDYTSAYKRLLRRPTNEQTGTAYGTSDSREIDEPIRVELMAMISSLTEEAGGESE